MNRTPVLLSAIGLISAGFFVFQIKYGMMDLEQRHRVVKRNIQETREALHVLKAEWSHLNDPRTLQTLCVKYLPDLVPLQGIQLVPLDRVLNGAKIPQNYDKKALDDLLSDATKEVAEHTGGAE